MNCYLPWYVILPSLGGEGLCRAVLGGPYPLVQLPLADYLFAFLLTLSSETAVMFLFLRGPGRRKFAAVLTANAITHPAAVYLWIPFASRTLDLSIRETLLGAELVIPLLEAAVYRRFRLGGWKGVLPAAVISNFVSWALVAWLTYR